MSMLRTLADIATPDGAFAILAMDQRNTLKRMYAAVGMADVADAQLIELKADMISELRGLASAFLIDPSYGSPALGQIDADGPHFGILLAAEPASRGEANGGEPRTYRDARHDAAWVLAGGGDAMKFLVQLRADRPVDTDGVDTRAEVLQVVKDVVADCRAAGVPSVVENLTFPRTGESAPTPPQRADQIIEAAVLLDECQPDLLKLEYPGDAANCRRLADAITGPWAVLSAGVDFDEFVTALRISCADGGCSGFIAGRSIWKEAVGKDRPDRRAFLADQGRRRLDVLVEVIDGRARPYQEVAR